MLIVDVTLPLNWVTVQSNYIVFDLKKDKIQIFFLKSPGINHFRLCQSDGNSHSLFEIMETC